MFRARDFNMPQVDAGEIYNYFYYRLLTLMLDDAKTADRYEATSDKVATQWEEKELTSLRESEVCRKVSWIWQGFKLTLFMNIHIIIGIPHLLVTFTII